MPKWIKTWWDKIACEHDFENVHQDDACSVERCKKCNHEIIYGGYR